MDELDTRAKMPHPDKERSVIEFKQGSYLESHLELESTWPSKRLAEEEQDDVREEGWELAVEIKKEPESGDTEFHLEFGGTQSSPGQELTDDYQCEVSDTCRRREEVPVAGFMIKTERESEESEPDLETSPQMQPSPSHPESHEDTSSPVRRGPQYRCHICSAEYGDVIQLTKHAKTHRRNKNSKVKVSNVNSSKVRKCRSCHKVLFHAPKKKKQNIDLCEKCSNVTSCSRQDDDVLKGDVSTTANESRSCNVVQPKDTTFLVHDVKSATTRTFTCQLCGHIFLSANGLLKHSIKSHKVKEKFICKVCKKKCPDQPALDSHTQDVHIVAKPFTCHVCGKSFYRKGHLEEHEAIHSGEKFFRCDRCDCKFTHRRSLSRHKHKCTVFSQGGATNSSSSNIKNCCHCSDKFTDRSDLTKHMRERHKDRLHVCEICDALFTMKSSLAMHYKAHAGDKPHQCNYCGKCFSRGNHLKVHRRLHTGESPFKCDGCSRTFKRKDHLKAHWKNIHVIGGQVRKAKKVWADEDCRCVCKVEGCGKRFHHRQQLARHRRKTHEQQEK